MNKRHMRRRRRSDRLAYSIDRLAKMTDLSRSTLYEEIAGRLVAQKAGRRTIVTRRDAIRWLRSLRQTGPEGSPEWQSVTQVPNSHTQEVML